MLGAISSRRTIRLVAPIGLHVKVVKTLGKRCLHTSSLLTATGWVTKGVLKQSALSDAWRFLGSNAFRFQPFSSTHKAEEPHQASGTATSSDPPVNLDVDFLSHAMVPDFDAVLPERRISNSVLRFSTVTYLDSGSYIPSPHKDGIDPRAFPVNPANFKVTLKVYLNDLELTDKEAKRLRCLVGKRYNPGKNEMTLTTARFMNRGHNMQYLVYLMENLVAEAKGQSHIKVAADAKLAEELMAEAKAFAM